MPLDLISRSLTALLIDAAVKATLLLTLAALLASVLARRRPAWQGLLWASGLVALPLLPVASALLPALQVPILPPEPASLASPAFPPPPADAPATTPAAPPVETPPGHGASLLQTFPSPPPENPSGPGSGIPAPALPSFTWPFATAAVYLLGLLFALSRVSVGLWRTARLRGSLSAFGGPAEMARLNRWRARLGVRAPVDLGFSDRVSIPTVVGIRRPIILIPAGLRTGIAPRTLDGILAHELAHVKRRDPLHNLLGLLATALYWYHPLAHLARRGLSEAREYACDDWSVSVLDDAASYATTLLEVTARVDRRLAVALGLDMARTARVLDRADRIVTLGVRVRPRLNRLAAAATVTTLFATAVVLGCVQPTCAIATTASEDRDILSDLPMSYTHQEMFGQTVSAAGITQLRLESDLENNAGPVRVSIEPWDRPEVRIEAKKRFSHSTREEAEKRARRIGIAVEKKESTLEVRTTVPGRSWGDWMDAFTDRLFGKFPSDSPRGRVFYTISTPRWMNIDLKCSNGSIQVGALEGRAHITTSGILKMQEFRGKLTGKSFFGDIYLSRFAGESDIEMEQGRITAEFSALGPRGARLRATNGNINIYLPDSLRADLIASAPSGYVDYDLPSPLSSQTDKHRIVQKINGGGPLLELSSTKGSIFVKNLKPVKPSGAKVNFLRIQVWERGKEKINRTIPLSQAREALRNLPEPLRAHIEERDIDLEQALDTALKAPKPRWVMGMSHSNAKGERLLAMSIELVASDSSSSGPAGDARDAKPSASEIGKVPVRDTADTAPDRPSASGISGLDSLLKMDPPAPRRSSAAPFRRPEQLTLDAGNGVENSERIRLNGRRLKRGRDYTVDYVSGALSLQPDLATEAANPSARLDISWDSRFLSGARKAISQVTTPKIASQDTITSDTITDYARTARLAALRSQQDSLRKAFGAKLSELHLRQARMDSIRKMLEARLPELRLRQAQMDSIRKVFEAKIPELRLQQTQIDSIRKAFETKIPALRLQHPQIDSIRKMLEARLPALRLQHPQIDSIRKMLEAKLPEFRLQQAQIDSIRKGFDRSAGKAGVRK